MSDRVLSLNNLHAGYGQTEILHDLSLYVDPNEIVAIIGPNGAGKSTLFNVITGLLRADAGWRKRLVDVVFPRVCPQAGSGSA